jgi:hypothetical protein
MTKETARVELAAAEIAMKNTETGLPIFIGVAGIVVTACGGILGIIGPGIILAAIAWYLSRWSGQAAAIEKYNIAKIRYDRFEDESP